MASKLEPKPHTAVLAKTHLAPNATLASTQRQLKHQRTSYIARHTYSILCIANGCAFVDKDNDGGRQQASAISKNYSVHIALHSAGGNGASNSGMEDAVLASSVLRALISSRISRLEPSSL